ncbi:MAG TPA: STAS domain-containing protein [Candidatus Elarobacter sp.]
MGEQTEPAIVRLEGEQDVSLRNEARLAFQRVGDNPRVIVDLTQLRFLDSPIISELYRAESRASALDGRLVIVTRSQRVLRLLSIAGLTARTPIVDTLEAALSSLRDG